jgi:hypothetical protein
MKLPKDGKNMDRNMSLSVKRFVSLPFLNPLYSRQDSLDGRSARRKAATYTNTK